MPPLPSPVRSLLRALALWVAFAAGTAAHGQSLPDWAAPSAPPYTPYEAPAEEGLFGPGVPLPPPDPVPVDGGLALLALAGSAYAVRRLRHTA